jgi:multisubunit Na+/H+ antiporter MnhC subunit
MADKLGPLSDGSPRDASKMVSNSHRYLYGGLVLAAIVIGFALYWFSVT